MNIHEFQAKQIIAKYGVTTLRNAVATSPDEAAQAVQQLGGSGPWVVKVHVTVAARAAPSVAFRPVVRVAV